MKRKISLILITVSCFLFGSASVVPIFSVEPAGEWTAIAQLLSPADMKTMNFSLIEGVKTLWVEEEKMLQLLLQFFQLSYLLLNSQFYGLKLYSMAYYQKNGWDFYKSYRGTQCSRVFLVAMTVLLLKEMPGGSRITLEAGFYAFGGSVILSLLTAQWIERENKKATSY